MDAAKELASGCATAIGPFDNYGQSTRSPLSATKFTFGSVAVAIFRARRQFVVLIAASWLLAACAIYLTPVTYVASTQVLLEPLPRKPIAVASDGVADPLDSAQADSRMHVAKSERLLKFVYAAVDWPKLNSEPADQRPSRVSALIERVRSFFPSPPENDEIRQTKSFIDFTNKVSAKRLGLSYVIEISFQAKTPRMAAFMANAITSAYLRNLVVSSQLDGELLQRRFTNIKIEEEALLAAIKKGEIPDESFPDANARVISAAILPVSKASPKTGLILMMGTAAAVALGLLLSIVRMQSDRTIRSGAEVFPVLRLRLLAIFTKAPRSLLPYRRKKGLLHGWPLLQGSIQSQPLLAEVLGSHKATQHKIVGFVSYGKHVGTSSVAIGIANQIGRLGYRPTLVDANSVSSALSQSIGVDNETGLTDALAGGTEAGDVRVAQMGSFDFVAQGSKDATLCVLGSNKLATVLRQLSAKGPVIVDLPALDASFDAQVVTRYVDLIVLVAAAERTTIDDLSAAAERLPSQKIAGFVLNFSGSKNRLKGDPPFKVGEPSQARSASATLPERDLAALGAS